MFKQQLKVKSSIIDTNNRLNRVFPSFNMLSTKFSSGNRLVDIFHNYFSFHSINRKSKKSKNVHNHKLNDITLQVLLKPKTMIVVTDANIKNQVITFIAYIYIFKKTNY